MRDYLEKILRNKVNTKQALEDIVYYLEKELDNYRKRYDYFGLKKEVWEKLIIKSVEKTICLIPFKSNFKNDMQDKITRFVAKKVETQDLTFLNNLVLKGIKEAKTYIEAGRWIEKELRSFNLSLGENNYNLLKEASDNFKVMVNKLGIANFNYQNYEKVIYGEYEIYIFIKPKSKNLEETMKEFNYWDSLLKEKIDIRGNVRSNKNLMKIKIMLREEDTLDKIYNLFKEKIGLIKRTDFDKLMVNYSLKELEYIIKAYKTLAVEKDYCFLNKIKEDLDGDKIDEKPKTKGIKWEDRYDYFMDKTINMQAKEEFIDRELSRLDKERIENIKKYLDFTLSRRSHEAKIAKRDLEGIKEAFNNYIASLELLDFDKTLELDFIPDYEIDARLKKEIVVTLLQNFPIYKQKIVKDYLYGYFRSDTNEGVIAKKIIEIIKEEYRIWKEIGLLPGEYYLLDVLELIGFDKKFLIEEFKKLKKDKIDYLTIKMKLIETKYRELGYKRKDYLKFLKENMRMLEVENTALETILEEYIKVNLEEAERRKICKNM